MQEGSQHYQPKSWIPFGVALQALGLDRLWSRRVYIVLLHRGSLSLADSRKQLGNSAYHWGLFVTPLTLNITRTNVRDQCGIFLDVTNNLQPYPDRHDFINHDGDWYFRFQRLVPSTDARFMAMVEIGDIPVVYSEETVIHVIANVEVPSKARKENCVWWTMKAAETLSCLQGLRAGFDFDDLGPVCLREADKAMASLKGSSETKLPLVSRYDGNGSANRY